MLTTQLDNQEERLDVHLLQGILVLDQTKRLSAYTCLKIGLKNGLFKRRTINGLVACALGGKEEAAARREEAPAPRSQADAKDDPDTTIILR